jgi:hypothetical protein
MYALKKASLSVLHVTVPVAVISGGFIFRAAILFVFMRRPVHQYIYCNQRSNYPDGYHKYSASRCAIFFSTSASTARFDAVKFRIQFFKISLVFIQYFLSFFAFLRRIPSNSIYRFLKDLFCLFMSDLLEALQCVFPYYAR